MTNQTTTQNFDDDTRLMFKGKDGRSYVSSKALAQADEEWKRQNLFFIVYDSELGRREIASGTGNVRICVGHFIERDEFGQEGYVPAYKTRRF